MDSSDSYVKTAYQYFGSFARKNLVPIFKDMDRDLDRANIKMTLVEFLALAVATCVVVFMVMSIFGTVIIVCILYIVKNTVSLQTGMISLILGFMAGMVAGFFIFLLFYSYPSVVVGERRKKIDDSLPFATLYLATISGSGAPPIAMFRALARFKEYGEISKEAQRIIEETDVLGSNLAIAIENAANRTPSEHLRDIFWGIKSIVAVGGDLQTFLHEKASSTMQEYKRRLAQFTQTLSMFIEMYITVVIVGSVFFMVLTTIFGAMAGEESAGLIVLLQFGITFLFLPFASVGFMVLIKGIAPSTDA